MNFRTILAFIAIAFISSLLNKNKTSTKPTDKIDRPVPQKSPPVDKVPDITEGKRKGFSKELERLFEEIKTEFDKAHGGDQKEQAHSSIEKVTKEENDARTKQKSHFPKGVSIKDPRKVAGSVYEGEIGKEEVYIKFNKKSVIQGIIMSEILQNRKF